VPEAIEGRIRVVEVAKQMIERPVLKGEDHHVINRHHHDARAVVKDGPAAAAGSFPLIGAAVSTPFFIQQVCTISQPGANRVRRGAC
jgi:hypothetical protein